MVADSYMGSASSKSKNVLPIPTVTRKDNASMLLQAAVFGTQAMEFASPARTANLPKMDSAVLRVSMLSEVNA